MCIRDRRGHLVVYRQYKPLAQKLQTMRNPAKFKEQHRAEFAAVSYTHLDVYKRQVGALYHPISFDSVGKNNLLV